MKLHDIIRDAMVLAALFLLMVTSVAVIRTMRAIDTLAVRADGAISRAEEDLARIEREALNHSDNFLQIETAAREQVSAIAPLAQGLRQDVLKRVDVSLDLIDKRSGELLTIAAQTEKDANAQLGVANGTLQDAVIKADGQFATANANAAKVIDPASMTLLNFNHQFMECKGNPACLQSTLLAFKGEALKTADSVRRMADVSEKQLEKALAPPCPKSPTMHGKKRAGCLAYNYTVGKLVIAAKVFGAVK